MSARVHLDGDQLIATRHLDAEPALVWEAFTTPAHLAAFWGGNHATVEADAVTVELRIGGRFQIETRGVDGSPRRLSFTYEVIDPPTRLVFTEPQTGLLTEIRLESNGNGTTVTVHQRRLPAELRTEQARLGLSGILDQLDGLIAELTRQRPQTNRR
jgi:uncharacterized protein YndB with AHSA1/START domain